MNQPKNPLPTGLMHSLQVLEFDSILEKLTKESETECGIELCKLLIPSFDQEDINTNLEITREAMKLIANDLLPSFQRLPNLTSALERANKGGELTGLEIARCLTLLKVQRNWKQFLDAKKSLAPNLSKLGTSLFENRGLEEKLEISVSPSGDVLDSASMALLQIRQRKQSSANRIVERIQEYLAGRSREWLSDPVYTIREGRYVLPLKAENRGKLKGIVHDTSGSGATIYVEPEDVVQMGNRLRELEVQEQDEIHRILKEISQRIGEHSVTLSGANDILGRLDFSVAKGKLAFTLRGCDPASTHQPSLTLSQARHPLLDPNLVVPIDISVGQNNSLLITGPNTGGKTVALKTAGLCAAMLHSGLFPPALAASFSPFTGIFADIGDEQSVSQSLSTFSGHIRNVADALKNAKQGCLVLLDELGAGTDPAEGAALATAILRDLSKKGCAIFASTHFGELKAFAYQTSGFMNAAMEFDFKSLQPTYKLVLGAAGASQALRIAEKYGIPSDVVESARNGLGTQHVEVSKLMEELDRSQKRARTAQSEADRKAADLQKALLKAQKEAKEAEEIRRSVRTRAAEQLDEALRVLRVEASDIFDALKTSPSRQNLDRAKSALGEAEARARKLAIGDHQPKPSQSELNSSIPSELQKGNVVRVDGFTQNGTILDIKNNRKVQVQIGVMKVWVPIGSVQIEVSPSTRVRAKSSTAILSLHRTTTISPEIHLRYLRADEAMEKLEKYVDDALVAGLDSVRIVHGKGEGILRRLTHDYLKSNRNIVRFRLAEVGEGGEGVTVAYFK